MTAALEIAESLVAELLDETRQFIAFDTASAELLRSVARMQGFRATRCEFSSHTMQWEISFPAGVDFSSVSACYAETF